MENRVQMRQNSGRERWLNRQKQARILFVTISALSMLMGLAGCAPSDRQAKVVRDDVGKQVECYPDGIWGFIQGLWEDNPYKAC